MKIPLGKALPLSGPYGSNSCPSVVHLSGMDADLAITYWQRHGNRGEPLAASQLARGLLEILRAEKPR